MLELVGLVGFAVFVGCSIAYVVMCVVSEWRWARRVSEEPPAEDFDWAWPR